jgi:hypothetical protein
VPRAYIPFCLTAVCPGCAHELVLTLSPHLHLISACPYCDASSTTFHAPTASSTTHASSTTLHAPKVMPRHTTLSNLNASCDLSCCHSSFVCTKVRIAPSDDDKPLCSGLRPDCHAGHGLYCKLPCCQASNAVALVSMVIVHPTTEAQFVHYQFKNVCASTYLLMYQTNIH